ncbi:MAG: hypothetical protein M3Q10_02915 [Chloroflexota bacterium]|nr:hypothetical protein [Chloroflexota bacterium]
MNVIERLVCRVAPSLCPNAARDEDVSRTLDAVRAVREVAEDAASGRGSASAERIDLAEERLRMTGNILGDVLGDRRGRG